MKKRLVCLLLATSMLSVVFTGCGEKKDYSKKVKEAAYGTMKGIADADSAQVKKFAEESVLKDSKLAQIDAKVMEDTFYQGFTSGNEQLKSYLDDDTKKVIEKFCEKLAKDFIVEFEIQSVKVDKDKMQGTVIVKAKYGYNPEKIQSSIQEVNTDLQGDMAEYQKENMDELQKLYLSDGEAGLYGKIYKDIIPMMLNKMSEKIEKTGSVEKKLKITVKAQDKDGDSWKVSKVEEYTK